MRKKRFTIEFDEALEKQEGAYKWEYFKDSDDTWQLVIGEKGEILDDMSRFIVLNSDGSKAVDVEATYKLVVREDGTLVVRLLDVILDDIIGGGNGGPAPTPLEERDTVTMRTLVNLRKRPAPNTDTPYIDTIAYGTDLEVLVDVVDQEIMDLLGLNDYIDSTYVWRYSLSDNSFYAERENVSGGDVFLTEVSQIPAPSGSTQQLNRSDGMRLQHNTVWEIPAFLGFGANNRSMAYFPTQAMVNVDREDMLWLLTEYRAMGIRNIRAYFSHRDYDFWTQMALMEDLIEEAGLRGINVVVVFMDSLGDSGHTIKEYEGYHTQALGHLNIQFYQDMAWRDHALPRIVELSKMLKNYDNVILDLCNEPALVRVGVDVREFLIPGNFYAFRQCWKELSEAAFIAGEGRFPIGIGVINTAHFKPWDWSFERASREFYEELPYVHWVSLHPYYEEDTSGTYFKFEPEGLIDIRVGQDLGKTAYMGEVGIWISQPDRPNKLLGIHDRLVGEGITATSYWEVDPGGIDLGYCGGHCISPYRNADYQEMLSAIGQINAMFYGV